MRSSRLLGASLAVFLLSASLGGQPAVAAVVISATGAAGINNDGGLGGDGTHYHWGPGTESQVNFSFGEEGRGVAEFNLSGVTAAVNSARLSFRVSGYNDLFYTPTPFEGRISLSGYVGNNAIELSDFQSPSIGSIGSFESAGLLIGDVLTFDVTSIFNSTLAGSLGVKWVPTSSSPEFSAITFNDISISFDTNGVPEPGTIALLGLGLAGLLATRRNRR